MFGQIVSIWRARTASSSQFGLVSRALFALMVMSALAATLPVAAFAADPTYRPSPAERHVASIINGHRLQPASADLPRPEMSARSAGIVDELYRQLINPRDGK